MSSRSRNQQEDIYGAVHRKEYEMKRLNAQHASLSDPVRMASKCSLTSFRLFTVLVLDATDMWLGE